ncbi:MAG: DUF4159 domain-containing protein [Bryobacterales bacterium]|nr:DUF4159 domain-containing protein [Bryobacterales bacterium]
MRWRTPLFLALLGFTALGVLWAQNPFREWPALEYQKFPIPADANRPAEWTRARLRYPDITGYPRNSMYGAFPGYWTMDYPRSDRHLLTGVRRLTRIDTRSVEQVVDLDGSDDIYNWPTIYGVEVGHWVLPIDQAKQLREYLLRGGFLMIDDFHGAQEWSIFEDSLRRVFPDRDWVDLPVSDPVFHVLYDISDRTQIPGAQFLESGRTFERDGYEAHWRGIYDDKGRIMVAICHNMDMGDAWEHSDDPEYPEKYASLAYRIGMNYFVYDLTH